MGGSYGLDNGDADQDLMAALIIAGAGVVVASTIFDLSGVKKAVRRHNLKAEKLQVALAPLVSPRAKALGLQARLSF